MALQSLSLALKDLSRAPRCSSTSSSKDVSQIARCRLRAVPSPGVCRSVLEPALHTYAQRNQSASVRLFTSQKSRGHNRMVTRMAPDEEKMTRRSPLDFPVEWERPAPGKRPDIFPSFSPIKPPLPQPLPGDPEEEDEDEEKDEEDPDKDPDQPEES